MAVPEPIEFQRRVRRVPVHPDAACSFAEGFAQYCEALLANLDKVKAPELEVGYAQAKVLLLERYADFLTDTPINHTNAAGRKKHRCLTEVLNETIKTIRERQRQALPPKLAVAPKPKPVAPATMPPPVRQKSQVELMQEALEAIY